MQTVLHKNSTKVAGMALAMPLSTNTANRPRNNVCCNGAPMRMGVSVGAVDGEPWASWAALACAVVGPDVGVWGSGSSAGMVAGEGVSVSVCVCICSEVCVCAFACSGAGARCHAHSATTKASANAATIAPTPAVALKTLAQITPNRPRPSRHPTKRLRWSSLPPSRAPQDWWAKPMVLRPRQQASKARLATPIKPSGEAGAGNSAWGKNSSTKPPLNNTLHARAQANTRVWDWANQRSVQRPNQGSMKASPKRVASSKAPIHDRGRA